MTFQKVTLTVKVERKGRGRKVQVEEISIIQKVRDVPRGKVQAAPPTRELLDAALKVFGKSSPDSPPKVEHKPTRQIEHKGRGK